MASNGSFQQDIATFLITKGFNPKPAWVSNFVSSLRPNVPQQGAKQTAWFRIINGDITTTLQTSVESIFPQNIHNASIKERVLKGPIPVQVLDIEDIGKSRWSQAEAIEAEERGETTRGHEIIRVVPNEDGNPDQPQEQTVSSGPHKLLLQDGNGTRLYGFELSSVSSINTNMAIGTKLVLHEVMVARGVLLLEPKSVTCMGGKIEELHQKWKAARKDGLKSIARASSQSGG